MNVENLHKLITFFEQLPDEKVDLYDWRTWQSDDAGYSSDIQLVNDCGTCGCIVGWLPVLTGVKVERFAYKNLAQYLCVSNAIAESLDTNHVSIHESVFPNDKAIVLYRLNKLLETNLKETK